jgi:hypothetical protein
VLRRVKHPAKQLQLPDVHFTIGGRTLAYIWW